jgi:hypothetical protein
MEGLAQRRPQVIAEDPYPQARPGAVLSLAIPAGPRISISSIALPLASDLRDRLAAGIGPGASGLLRGRPLPRPRSAPRRIRRRR